LALLVLLVAGTRQALQNAFKSELRVSACDYPDTSTFGGHTYSTSYMHYIIVSSMQLMHQMFKAITYLACPVDVLPAERHHGITRLHNHPTSKQT
jgi:hypothetical protein